MNSAQLSIIHETIAEGDWIGAANLAFAADGVDLRVDNEKDAKTALQSLERNLHDAGLFREQAVLLWGNTMFNANPSVVRAVFDEVALHSRLLIQGSSSLSKTFSGGVLFYLFWRMDPMWTNVTLCAVNEAHLRSNLFSHIVALHNACALPITDNDKERIKINETDLTIRMDDALPEMKIEGVLLKQSQVSSGALRGKKPKPYRKVAHPKFGNSSRVLILIDEGTSVPAGAYEDIKTTEASIDPSRDTVKIVIAYNPIDLTSKCVQMAEPEDGWDIEQVDTLYKWVGKSGYNVLRLDAKNFENVVERKVIYPGMHTYEAYLGFLKQGDKSAAYWALARGFPPLSDSAWTVIPPGWMQSQKGEPVYVGKVTTIAAVDTALQGSDKALMAVGRWGEAAGWRDIKGVMTWFEDRLNPGRRKTRHVLVIDQIFTLPKTNNTVEVIQEVMGRCKQMGIQPEDVAMDATGNAAGVWSHAVKYWGNVLGVQFGEKASEIKVISEDQQTAYDIYDGKVTELWFAFKRWLDPIVCAVLMNPTLQVPELFSQMTTRRYNNVKGGKVRIEAKEVYRARTRMGSPDEADVSTLLLELVRQRMNIIPGMQETTPETGQKEGREKVSLKNADEADTLDIEDGYAQSKLEVE